VTRKIRVHPDEAQLEALWQYAGTHRLMWNNAKAFADVRGAECREERIAELEALVAAGDHCAHAPLGRQACGRHGCLEHAGVEGPRAPDTPSPKCMAMTAKGAACGLNHDENSLGCKKHAGAQGCQGRPCTFLEPKPRCQRPRTDSGAEVGTKARYYCAEHGTSESLGVKYTDAGGNYLFSLPTLRGNTLVPDRDLEGTALEWQKAVPFATRQGAIKKYASAMKAFFELRKVDPDARPPGFLSKKHSSTTFCVRSNAISYSPGRGLRIFPRRFSTPIRLSKKDEKKVARAMGEGSICDSEMMCDTSGRWYILLVIKGAVAPRPAERPFGAVFLDPGGRTMDTFYSPDGIAGKLGDGFYGLIAPLLLKADAVTSKCDRMTVAGRSRTRRRLRIRAQALRTKVRDTVRDLHRKMCRFLCDNFGSIYVTPFTGQTMAAIKGRPIASKAVRNMMTFAHGEFRVKLQEYAAARGVDVTVVSEAFTTRTCTWCGTIMDVGAAHVVRCGHCGLQIDRDVTAGRNIGIRTACSREEYMGGLH
jgi:putative transposase